MTILVILTCIGSIVLGHLYVPPDQQYRIWPDVSPATATVAALLAVNVAVCIAWRYMPLWPLMTRYFMHAPGYPRAAQALLNVFSHVQYEHLVGNMMFLLLLGGVCHDLVGRGVFVGTFVSAGAVGSLATLYWANLGRGLITAHSVGASAALWGIAALYCLLTDAESIKIPFIKDMEVPFFPKTVFAAFLAMELWTAIKGRRRVTTMDHASHFGGMAVGMTVAGYLRATGFHERRRKEKGLVEGEREKLDIGMAVKGEFSAAKAGMKKVVQERA